MTTYEHDFAKKITGYLDASNRELKSGTLYRLQQARAAALAHAQAPRRVPDLVLARAGSGGTMAGPRPFYAQVRFWIGIGLIAFAVLGWQQWQAYQAVKDAEEVDAQLLTSDLPFDAYLDRGFQVWLKTAGQP
jgi:hypothetical protein